MLNQARGPVGTLIVSDSSPDLSTKPDPAAPPRPLWHPSRAQSPRASCARTREPSRVPSGHCSVPGACGKAAAPIPVPCAQRASCPWSSLTQWGTDGRARTPGRCVWHHSTVAQPTLTHGTGAGGLAVPRGTSPVPQHRAGQVLPELVGLPGTGRAGAGGCAGPAPSRLCWARGPGDTEPAGAEPQGQSLSNAPGHSPPSGHSASLGIVTKDRGQPVWGDATARGQQVCPGGPQI